MTAEESVRAARALGYSEPAVARAAVLAISTPEAARWERFVPVVAGSAGAALVASGVVTFFAYNWERFGGIARIGVAQSLVIAAFALAWRSWDRLPGRIALTTAAVLVGALLAVFGQTYQTGAPIHTLFLGWAALILPWALVGRFEALWLLFVVVLQTGASAWQNECSGGTDSSRSVAWSAALVYLLALVAWEVQARRASTGLHARWLPRTFATGAAVALGVAVVQTLLTGDGLVPLTCTGAIVAAGLVFYRGSRMDLFVQTLALAVTMTALTTAAARALTSHGSDAGFALILLALFVVAQGGVAVTWLRREMRRASGP